MNDVRRAVSRQPVSPPKSSEPATDIARLDMADKIRNSHYNSIWEQQKHFTWLISIILSAQAVFANDCKGWLVRQSGNALRRLCRWYSNFPYWLPSPKNRRSLLCPSSRSLCKEYRKVYPDEQPPYRAQKPNKSILRLISSCLLGKAGVRDHFQILFLAFTIVFAAIAVYACVSL